MRFSNDHGQVRLMISKIAFGRIGFQLGQYVPDSGQEHTADSNDGFLVTTAGLGSTITFLAFKVLVGCNDSI